MTLFDITLIATTLLCALTAGLILGFAVVVMPGIAKLSDRGFLLAFKEMDGVIQNKQPLFMFVWVGSIVSVVLLLILGTRQLSGLERYVMWFACSLYLIAVQGPTIRFNIPLNNAVQALKIDDLNDSDLARARRQFETPWNRWNLFRTLAAIVCVIALLMLQLILR